MTKNQAWVSVASSVGATMISYVILELVVKQMAPHWKFIIVGIVGIAAFIIAFWKSRKTDDNRDKPSRTSIGTSIQSKGSISLEDVSVDSNQDGDVKIGTSLSAEKDVTIKGIEVDSKGSK